MKIEEKTFLISLLTLILLMVVYSFQYGGGAKILPMVSGIFSLLIVGFIVTASFSPKISAWYQKYEASSVVSDTTLEENEKKREISVVAWFVGCTAMIYLLGFLVTIPIFLMLFLKLWAKESWVLSVVLSVVVLAVVYFTFVYVLRVPLHGGLLFA